MISNEHFHYQLPKDPFEHLISKIGIDTAEVTTHFTGGRVLSLRHLLQHQSRRTAGEFLACSFRATLRQVAERSPTFRAEMAGAKVRKAAEPVQVLHFDATVSCEMRSCVRAAGWMRKANKLYMARSRLYRSQLLQVNAHFKALAEIYKIHIFSLL